MENFIGFLEIEWTTKETEGRTNYRTNERNGKTINRKQFSGENQVNHEKG